MKRTVSNHYASYAVFIGDSENKRRETVYCRNFEECLANEDKPYFRWRNLSVYREFCYWKRKNEK